MYGNILYIFYVLLLVCYMYYIAYPMYIESDASVNYEAAQDTIISYTHKNKNNK